MPLDRPSAAHLPVVLRSVPGSDRVLTAEALVFVAELQARFGLRLNALLVGRARRQARVDRGEMPDYLPETTDIRRGIWEVGPAAAPLADRRTEIAVPATRAALVAALNSGARVVIADLEDTTASGFRALIAAQAALMDWRDGLLDHEDPVSGARSTAREGLLALRPRGLHVAEVNVLAGGAPISAALFDAGLFLVHSARALAATGRGPVLELAKLDSQDEARLWADVLRWSESELGLAPGTIRATVLVETPGAAFEMDEIVWQLRDHVAGLKLGLPNYVFGWLRTLRAQGAAVLPDRAAIEEERAFLGTVAARLVKVAHRRGIHAIAAESEGATEALLARALRDLHLGFDGCAVARLDQVAPVAALTEAEMPGPNQIRRPRQDYRIEPAMLLRPQSGPVTEAGLCAAVATAMTGIAAWIASRPEAEGASLPEAELARLMLWHWREHGVQVATDGGPRRVDADWLAALVQAEIVRRLDRMGPHEFHRSHQASAARILLEAATAATPPDFITSLAQTVQSALD